MDLSDNQQIVFRKDYKQPTYWVSKVDLAFVINRNHTDVRTQIVFYKNASRNSHTLKLDGDELELSGIAIDGRPLSKEEYQHNSDGLVIAKCPDQFTLTVENRIYPSENTFLEGLYQSGEFLLTQCEAEGFRKITFYPDRPDVLAVFDVTIIADKKRFPVLLSNGNLIIQSELNDGRHYVKWNDPHPKPSYLFALVAGDLDYIESSFTTHKNRQVQLRIYTEKQNIDRCDFAMEALQRSMLWDEERFGLACDLDQYNIVVTDDFNMGAMENKGLNIFNSKYVLASQFTATDSDYLAVEAVIGHEYFHNWTGNRITCRDWFQLSLKEGLTVFRDQEFTSDLHSRAVKRIQDVRLLKSHQFAEDAGPMSHPVRPDSYLEINNFYTLTVYEKGSEVVRMYHTLLGEEGFRKGMDLYIQRFDGQAVTCDDFRQSMADASAVDLSQFGLWYSQNGTPQVIVNEVFDEEKHVYHLDIEQHQPGNYKGDEGWKPMHIPMRTALYLPDGSRQVLDEAGNKQKVLEIKAKKQRFSFSNVKQRPVASLFQNFSAPVNIKRDISSQELSLLMQCDQDPYNRWEAAQTLLAETIKERYFALCKNLDYVCSDVFFDSLETMMVDEDADPAFLAEAMMLPSLKSLINELSHVEVLLLNQAREWLKLQVAQQFKVEILSIYNQNFNDEDYAFVASQVASRSLKNTCLSFLMCLQDPEINALCFDQYDAADNFTDLVSALTLLVHHQVEGYEAYLEKFYQQYSEQPLIINRWFSIQATQSSDDALERVKKLMSHPKFSIKRPNTVRSLIGGFCSANPVGFHKEDGSGYSFLADQVIELNAINPQVAARMVGIFNDWKKFDSASQQKIKEELLRIQSNEKLSADVREIVDKAIGA